MLLKLNKLHLATFCCLVLSIASTVAQDMPLPQVEVLSLSKKELAPVMKLKGNVLSTRDTIISSEVSARLESVTNVGTSVKVGEPLAKLDIAKLNWEVEKNKAQVNRLMADLEFRKGEVVRFTALAKRDNASKTQLQQELATQAMLEQDIVIANANLKEAKLIKERAYFAAPFSGIVAERYVDEGEFIQTGEPMLRLVDTNNKEIDTALPVALISLLSIGDTISVMASNDAVFQLSIEKIIPISNPQTRMGKIRINANDTDLIVGDAVTAFIPRQAPEVRVAIPRDAVVIRGSKRFVYLVSEGNVAEQIEIDILYSDDEWIATEQPFKEGQKIIIRGAERLQPNSKVQIL